VVHLKYPGGRRSREVPVAACISAGLTPNAVVLVSDAIISDEIKRIRKKL